MKYDIQIHGNAISGRQCWAYTCNSNEIPVLIADLTPLTDEEMQEVKKRAAQWCVR